MLRQQALRCGTVALVVAAIGLVAPAPAFATSAVQVITVRVYSATSTMGMFEAWQRPLAGGAYQRVYGPVRVYVGAGGVGAASEYRSVTPAGNFALTETYGRLANPGTTLPYHVLDWSDWWISDVNAAYYNMHYRCTVSCPFDRTKGEQMLAAGSLYDYLAVINYNRSPVVKGAGSAFFLHVSHNQPTAGCVAIPEADLIWILRWLKPAYAPIISIRVG